MSLFLTHQLVVTIALHHHRKWASTPFLPKVVEFVSYPIKCFSTWCPYIQSRYTGWRINARAYRAAWGSATLPPRKLTVPIFSGPLGLVLSLPVWRWEALLCCGHSVIDANKTADFVYTKNSVLNVPR